MPSRSAVSVSTPVRVLASVTSAYGRVGHVIGVEGDYTLDQMGDVDTSTTSPTAGDFLGWDGTNWSPEDTIDGGTY